MMSPKLIGTQLARYIFSLRVRYAEKFLEDIKNAKSKYWQDISHGTTTACPPSKTSLGNYGKNMHSPTRDT